MNSPRYLPDLGYQSVCAFLHPPDDAGFAAIRERAARWQAPLEEVVDRGPVDLRVLPQLLQICRRHNVKVWHAHDYKTNLLGLMLRTKHPMKLVTTVHGWVERSSKLNRYYFVDRFTLPRYQKVICVSDDLFETCRKYGVPENRLHLIANAVDTGDFSRRRPVAAAKADLGWPASRFRIGAVGRLSAEKAFDLLIRSIAEIVQRGIDIGLVIAGDGPERSAILRLISELGLQERVQLLGFQTDLRPIYESLDLFVLSSLREGLPNVLLEAMSLEVPVVATEIAGIPHLIMHRRNGLLIEPGSQSAIVDAIVTVLSDQALRERLAAAGRRTIEDRYSFAVRMQKVAAVYDELLQPVRAEPTAHA